MLWLQLLRQVATSNRSSGLFLDGIWAFNALSSQLVYIRVCNGQDSSLHLRANPQISRTVDGPRSCFSRYGRRFTNQQNKPLTSQ